MQVVEVRLTKVSAATAKFGARMVAQYREEGKGSNRSDWERITLLAGAVVQASKSAPGAGVEVTELFRGHNYHVVHRALGSAVFAKYWPNVQVLGIVHSVQTANVVTGISSTKSRDARLFLIPAKLL